MRRGQSQNPYDLLWLHSTRVQRIIVKSKGTVMTDLSRMARRITWVLFANQSLASAGFIAAATINSIIGAKLGGSASYAGVPSAVYQVGAAFAASAWGYIMDRIGRRNGI